MPRLPRLDIGKNYYHVLNRANARMQIFFTYEDYVMFEKVIEEAWEMFEFDLLAYSIMPNHFHFVVHTKEDGELQKVFPNYQNYFRFHLCFVGYLNH